MSILFIPKKTDFFRKKPIHVKLLHTADNNKSSWVFEPFALDERF